MSNDDHTVLVSERYNQMLDAIEEYVQAEKMATRRHVEGKLVEDRERVQKKALEILSEGAGPMVVSVTGATEEDEYEECDDCEHCACRGEN